MARSIAKGPKPRAGYATVNKNAPKPFAKAARPAPAEHVTIAKSSEPLGTVQVALLRAQKHGLDKLDARILLLHTLGKPSTDLAWLLAHDQDRISTAQADIFSELCARRRANEPLAYIVGYKEFYGLRLKVDQRVLDPRADTETLVTWALQLLPMPATSKPEQTRFLDLGTGSGAVALAIQSQRPGTHVSATDASADALDVARANAQALQLSVQFYQGHWLQAVADQKFDIIASNPPYVAAADPHLAALQHEPASALASGADGLDDIRQIVAHAPAHLHSGGWLLLEHGYDQADAVRTLLAAKGFAQLQSRMDLAGIERCTGGQWPGP